MQQPIARKYLINPKDIILDLPSPKKHKNIYTFNPTSSVHDQSFKQYFKQQTREYQLNPQNNINNRQKIQHIYFDIDRQNEDEQIQIIPKGNFQNKDQPVQDYTELSQHQFDKNGKAMSGLIVKQKIKDSVNNIVAIQSNNKNELKIQKQHKIINNQQRQFNRLALSLLGVRRTKFNKSCLDNKSSFSIRQIGNKKKLQIDLGFKPAKSRYKNNQQDRSQIYHHCLYPFATKKIEDIKQQINKISEQSRLRRNYAQSQRKQTNFYSNYQKEFQEIKNKDNQKQKILFSQILHNSQNKSTQTYKITIKTSLSSLKNLLNQSLNSKSLQIQVPSFFLKPPSQLSTYSSTSTFNSQILTNQLIHLFSSLDIPITNINIRKYSNCLVIINHNICLIWHDNGSNKKYLGSWKNKYFDEGQKQGLGLQWSPSKYVYYGQFKNNKKNGFGIMKLNNCKIMVGYWRNGKYVQFGIEKNR